MGFKNAGVVVNVGLSWIFLFPLWLHAQSEITNSDEKKQARPMGVITAIPLTSDSSNAWSNVLKKNLPLGVLPALEATKDVPHNITQQETEPKGKVVLANALGQEVPLPKQTVQENFAPYGNNLSVLVATGILNHPFVKSKMRLADTAQFGVDTAKWQFFPTPSLSIQRVRAGSNDTVYTGAGANQILTLGLQQPIWTGGKLSAGLSLAEKQFTLTLADIEESKAQIAQRIVSGYGSWASAHEKVIVYQSIVNYNKELQGLIRRRIDSGLAPESDFIFSKGRLDQALSDLETVKTQKNNALLTLSSLLGTHIEESDLLAINRPLLNYPIQSQSMLDYALEHHPSILKARAQIAIQESQINVAKSNISPTVSLSFQAQHGDFGTTINGIFENRVFLNVTSTFGAGLSSFSQISGAMAQRDAAMADEEAMRRAISEEILSEIALIKSIKVRVKSTQAACDAASSTEKSWQRQFLVGKKAWQDVLNATRELANCKVTLADAQETLLSLNWRLAIYSMGVEQSLGLATANEEQNNPQ